MTREQLDALSEIDLLHEVADSLNACEPTFVRRYPDLLERAEAFAETLAIAYDLPGDHYVIHRVDWYLKGIPQLSRAKCPVCGKLRVAGCHAP